MDCVDASSLRTVVSQIAAQLGENSTICSTSTAVVYVLCSCGDSIYVNGHLVH